ncbi:uL30 family ribosomal protein [Candidatus Pacearchaeota archaeon]|nr:uL30 family ribosomal protein [Candidatus Pacearchaeota archaeon]
MEETKKTKAKKESSFEKDLGENKNKIEHKPSHGSGKITVVIRIAGEVKVKPEVRETLDRLRLRRKYTCILVKTHDKALMGMVDRVKYHVSYGEIEKDILEKLIRARAMSVKKEKINAGDISDEIIKGKSLSDLGLKPFFRLHPPRGGIRSKIQYPKGVLGNNKQDINKLVERML